MSFKVYLVFCAWVSVSWCLEDVRFPPGFKFGVATASYQVEGAWNVSDKSESIWDRFSHVPGNIKNGDTGDVACDSYHNWKRDIEMLVELGVHYYRFSISWNRLLPNAFDNKISEDGKRYYNDLIDALIANGIEPVVTIFHWDLPQRLQELGGWTNPLISDWFADYSRVVFSLYADRVNTWITINEPSIICEMNYNTGLFAPALKIPDYGYHICAKNVLIAHAKAWRIYDQDFKPKYKGKVSITNNLSWLEAASPEDEELAELGRQQITGRYSHPIYSKEGGWPPSIVKAIAEYSKKKSYPWSLLPAFTQTELELVRGTYDFYAFNQYTSRMVRKANEGEELMPWPIDGLEINAKFYIHPQWKNSSIFWFALVPTGLRKQLQWLKKNYGDIPIFISENGYPTLGGLNDKDRIESYKLHLEQVLLAINEDGVNVTAFTAWSMMDNFEWLDGYSTKFGLYEVDFSSPERTRTPRASAFYYKSIIESHSLNVTENIVIETSKTEDTLSITPFIVIGILILLAIIVAFCFYLRSRSQNEKKRKGSYVSCKSHDDALVRNKGLQ